MSHMIEETTEARFFAEYDRTKADLAHARNEILLLSGQLKDAGMEQEKLAYKNDFLQRENARLLASRDQYERVAIRAAAVLDGALTAQIATIEKLQAEIREAAFTKTPAIQPSGTEEATKIEPEKIAERFGSGHKASDTLPKPII